LFKHRHIAQLFETVVAHSSLFYLKGNYSSYSKTLLVINEITFRNDKLPIVAESRKQKENIKHLSTQLEDKLFNTRPRG
jgi:hydroxymethylglutaryl-CoA reductase